MLVPKLIPNVFAPSRLALAALFALTVSPSLAQSRLRLSAVGIAPPGTNTGAVIRSLAPASEDAGGPAFTLSVTGSGFAPGSIVEWDGEKLNTTFLNASLLDSFVPAFFLSMQGTATITVNTGSAVSNAMAFEIAPAIPAVSSIDTFVGCVNSKLGGINKTKPVSIADTVMNAGKVTCLPEKCTLTVTMSPESDQDACAVFAGEGFTKPVDFPRVILSCPIPGSKLRIRPTYRLCPPGFGGHEGNSVEIGQDQEVVDLPKETGTMILAGGAPLVIPPSKAMQFKMLDANAAKNTGNKAPGSLNCNMCHITPAKANPDKSTFLLAKPINPFGAARTARGMKQLAQYILYTNEPGQKATAPKPATLPVVCKAISDNQAGILKQNSQAPDLAANLDAIISLCNNLAAYADAQK